VSVPLRVWQVREAIAAQREQKKAEAVAELDKPSVEVTAAAAGGSSRKMRVRRAPPSPPSMPRNPLGSLRPRRVHPLPSRRARSPPPPPTPPPLVRWRRTTRTCASHSASHATQRARCGIAPCARGTR
jgi:hypothetical protein